MGFWSWLPWSPPAGETPNANPPSSVGPPAARPGDPRQVMLDPQAPPVINRGLPALQPSSWSGYPGEWATQFDSYGMRLGTLVDTAWAAIDLNASILSSLPMYRVRAGTAIGPVAWMTAPGPGYVSWAEFAKCLFWDYQMGEAFVLSLARNSADYPASITLVPPWMVQFEQGEYRIHGYDLEDQRDLLHIRNVRQYQGWRGVGPLEAAGARVTSAALIDRYQADYLESGGIPRWTVETDRPMNQQSIDAVKVEWRASRAGGSAADPAVLGGGVGAHAIQQPSVRDSMLVELSQWNESRIAVHCGVPPFLMSLPSGDHMTYRNVEMLLDFHFRGSLWPKANTVMTALSNWALPAGQSVEVNGDQYVRPDALSRAQAYAALFNLVDPATGERAITVNEIRTLERFGGDGSTDVTAATVLTGGDQ
jgi:hypothetical protein